MTKARQSFLRFHRSDYTTMVHNSGTEYSFGKIFYTIAEHLLLFLTKAGTKGFGMLENNYFITQILQNSSF